VHPYYRTLVASTVLAALAMCAGLASGQEPPLPDAETFRREARKRLRDDRAILSQYTYLERREEIDISAFGGVSEGPVKTYEVYPSKESGNTWKRLIAVDGEPLSEEELAENDREHQRHLREKENESPSERARRLRKEEKEQQEEQAVLDEVFALYDMTMERREIVHGHPTIFVSLEPRADYEPKTKEGKWMKHVRIRAWVHEHDYEIVRVEADVLEDITVGWGLIGRVHKGSTAIFDRTKVNGEVWLPKRSEVKGTGRTLVFRPFAVDAVTEWWGYRKRTPRVSTTSDNR
jgi:hypothetical protein